ncbi:MAG TPA: type I pullulanase, partial [Bacillota bacterium]|nr:type I pullulanase [Bacillota bacterium]
MKELGVTHVQLLPFFDFGVVDETKLDDPDYNSFNWGYMPLNFNALEGSYSSDPYDGLSRISEMKQVVMAFTEADIRINMDVVYNHTGLSADSNFNLIVPGYYYRMTDSGDFSNGSGTGNETASERYMMRKFMIDSTTFWATEYNISGFRFDLMSLHDIETMTEIAATLHDIDPTIMVYGEPWTGGT